MIPEIIRQINSSPELSTGFQKMTEEAFDELELAKTIRSWFIRQYDENVAVRPAFGVEPDNKLERKTCDLMDNILGSTIHGITNEQWLTIAQHLWQRYWTQRTADQIGFPH
jgi:hypothetical protein